MGSLIRLVLFFPCLYVLLFVTIAVHEAGHNLAARAFGIHALEVSVGSGPKIWSFQTSESDFRLNAYPNGGQNAFIGTVPNGYFASAEYAELVQTRPEQARLIATPSQWIDRAPPLTRLVISAAGSLTELLFLSILFCLLIRQARKVSPAGQMVPFRIRIWAMVFTYLAMSAVFNLWPMKAEIDGAKVRTAMAEMIAGGAPTPESLEQAMQLTTGAVFGMIFAIGYVLGSSGLMRRVPAQAAAAPAPAPPQPSPPAEAPPAQNPPDGALGQGA